MNGLTLSDTTIAPTAGRTPQGLSHLALLRVAGPDARTFLDAQLTRNVPSGDGTASPAGYCSVKGRLLASFVMWSDGASIGLLLSRDIADALVKRLKMYVFRAKVTIDDVTAAHTIDGAIDRAIDGAVDGAVAPTTLPAAIILLLPWAVVRIGDETWIRYPDADGRRRFLRIAPRGDGDDEGMRPAATVDTATWRWLDIRSGLPLVTVATQDRFVPQMLNLEALGGVDFKKGCYPGQEVVARSQYLGKLKRRTALASLGADAALPAPGSDVWSSATNEPAGVVVDAERGPDRRIALLVELPLAQFDADTLHVGTFDGDRLQIEPLPYPLPDNEVFVRPKL